MLDEKDLQAIAQLMSQQKQDILSDVGEMIDKKIDASEARMMAHTDQAIEASEARMMAHTDQAIEASEARMMAYTDQAIEASEARMTAHTDQAIEASEVRMTAHTDQAIEASEARMTAHTDQAIEASESRMMVLMESYFGPRFDLLAEGQQIIREQMVTKEDLRKQREEIDAEITLLKAAVKRNTQEIEKLKKAQ